MTIVGIALTAWLLPALTRQWDDRQKAQELKATVAADMASMTAKAVLNATPARTPPEVVEATLLSDWQIESRLQLYFPPSIAAAWEMYSFGMHLIVNAPWIQTRTAFVKAQDTAASVTPGIAHRAASMLLLLKVYSDPRSASEPPYDPEWANTLLDDVEAAHPGVTAQALALHPGGGLWALEAVVVGLERAIAAEIIAAHPTGYSTTTRDLIHDLLPF